MSSILAMSGFVRAAPEATGRPGYHPCVLLRLCIYGYLNQVQSSRRLEREAGRTVTVRALNVLAYNLTRVMNIIGIRPLIAAMRA